MFKKHLSKYIISFLAISALIFAGLGCKAPSKEAQEASTPRTLNLWTVFDDYEGFGDIIASYRKLHPNITINFRKLRYDEYDQALLEAMAEDRAPDIVSIHNTWLGKYQTKLLPLPATRKMAAQEVQGTLKKELVGY